MNRPYRAWDKKWKRWILPEDISYYKGEWYFERRGESGDIIETAVGLKEIDLEQNTGLSDKNGKEAYHKDTCVGDWPYAGKCIIEWDEKRCGFYLEPVKGDGLLGRAAYDKEGANG